MGSPFGLKEAMREMSEQERSGDSISAIISGGVSGQVAVGKGITQAQTSGTEPQVTDAELEELRQIMEDIKAVVEAEAPPELQQAATERLGELEQAVTAKEPDLSTMEYVKRWFSKNVPKCAGYVTALVVHPLVGKLVQAGGEALFAEFRRRFQD